MNPSPNNTTPDAFGNVPKPSEDFGKVPHDAEAFRTIPKDAEGFGSMPHSAERTENHTLTVREVARMFEAAGVARTERSITNWCRATAQGMARLDAHFDPNDRKYYITPQSVERAIAEEKAKMARHEKAAEISGNVPHGAQET